MKIEASKVYLFIEFTASAFFSMMFVTMSLYEATIAGLTPLQLALVGTTLEISAFLFEIPTRRIFTKIVYHHRLCVDGHWFFSRRFVSRSQRSQFPV